MNELPDWAQQLLAETPVAHLGLLDEDGHPRVQPITFARVDDALWTAIDDKPKRSTPARIARLQADPRATITVDRYDDDWTRLAWVQVLGTATIEPLRDDVVDALTARYPVYREQPPRGPLIRLTPIRTLCWRAAPTAPC
jgi:PPOX class probable F420-dependent enzyme